MLATNWNFSKNVIWATLNVFDLDVAFLANKFLDSVLCPRHRPKIPYSFLYQTLTYLTHPLRLRSKFPSLWSLPLHPPPQLDTLEIFRDHSSSDNIFLSLFSYCFGGNWGDRALGIFAIFLTWGLTGTSRRPHRRFPHRGTALSCWAASPNRLTCRAFASCFYLFVNSNVWHSWS